MCGAERVGAIITQNAKPARREWVASPRQINTNVNEQTNETRRPGRGLETWAVRSYGVRSAPMSYDVYLRSESWPPSDPPSGFQATSRPKAFQHGTAPEKPPYVGVSGEYEGARSSYQDTTSLVSRPSVHRGEHFVFRPSSSGREGRGCPAPSSVPRRSIPYGAFTPTKNRDSNRRSFSSEALCGSGKASSSLRYGRGSLATWPPSVLGRPPPSFLSHLHLSQPRRVCPAGLRHRLRAPGWGLLRRQP